MAEFYFRAPRFAHLPHLETILDSIGNDRAVARKLGLSESTIRKYRKAGQAPRPVMYTRCFGRRRGGGPLLMQTRSMMPVLHTCARCLWRGKTRFLGSRSRFLKSVFPKGCRSLPIRNFSGWVRDEIRKANELFDSAFGLVLPHLPCPLPAPFPAESCRLHLPPGY